MQAPGHAPDVAEAELARWVELAATGDVEALRSLLTRVTPAVRAVVVRALGRGHGDVEDLVQESLLGLVRALDAFRGECSVLHYARRIALWRVLEEQKRKHAQKRAALAAPEYELEQVAAQAEGEGALGHGAQAELRALMYTLRPEQAEVLALRHVLEYSVEEIATATGVPANTVRSRLRLAKEALRERIAAHPSLHELNPRRA